jgi:hypothetical protein
VELYEQKVRRNDKKGRCVMKKIVAILVVFMVAAPVLAEVAVTATDEGEGVVAIAYTSDVNVSAFALDITVTDGNIVGISDYFAGDCNATEKGYGIFPGNFKRYINPVNPWWEDSRYTPVGYVDDYPGDTQPGLGSNGITVEMGALYEPGNQPALSGTLCKVTVNKNATLCVTANEIRGKVVLEDSTSVDPNLAGACTEVAVCCYGDRTDDGDDLPDAGDVSGLAVYLYFNGDPNDGWKAAMASPYECMDLNNNTYLDAGDVSALAVHLYFNGDPNNGWLGPCYPMP